MVTDYVILPYIMHVFILTEHRGKGYAKQLMKAINEEPRLKLSKVLMFKIIDAHNLY